MSDNYYSPYGANQMNNSNNNMGMNMGNYFNNPMQPQMDRLQRLTQSQQMQQSYIPQQFNTNVNWVQVSNMQSAKEHIVQPNNTIWMRDTFKPQIYIKEVDSMGTTKFKAFQLVEIDDNGNANQNQNQDQNVNEGFVPIAVFNDLKQEVIDLKSKVTMYESLFQGQNVVTNKEKTSSKKGGANNESTK